MIKSKKDFNIYKPYLSGVAIAFSLFIVNIIVGIFFPYITEHKRIYGNTPYIVTLIITFILYSLSLFFTKKKSTSDLIIVIYVFFLIWEVSYKSGLLHNDLLIPSPQGLFHVFVEKPNEIILDILSSIQLLAVGYALAIILGTTLGLLAGWVARVREVLLPISNAITLIPPLLFSSYLIMILPTFRAAAIGVIFFAAFWPTFQGTVASVGSIERKIIEAAKVMGVKTFGMLTRVIFPYCLPGIIKSISKSLRGAFMCLAGAEMLGISSGIGYFVEKYKSFADYRVVLAGIVTIGFVTTVIDIIVNKIERSVIKWQD